MNKVKYIGCKFESCDKPHRRNGYCANHSQKFKRGTLGLIKTVRLCSIENCGRKHYCKGFCLRHFRRDERRRIATRATNFRSNYEIGDLAFTYKEHSSWSKAVKRYLGDYCMICGWNEAPCDTHHIIAKSKSGLNTLKNAIVLCPNHHKLADIGILTVVELQVINSKAVQLTS
jgi:HNH endonuclease